MNRNTGGGRKNLAGLTLTAVLADRKLSSAGPEVSPPPRIQSFRTLLDIIQEDQTFSNAHVKDNKKSWKVFKGKLRLRRGVRSGPGSSWTSSMRMPTSEIPINRGNNTNAGNSTSSRMFTRRASAGLPFLDQSTQPDMVAVPDINRDLMLYPRSRSSPSLQRSASHAAGRTSDRVEDTNSLSVPGAREDGVSPTEEADGEAEEGEGEGQSGEEDVEAANEEGGGEQQPVTVRMSLMALLAETDREMGLGGSAYSTYDEEEEEQEDTATATEYNSCCVCMVRHKGAAFIPCGHTFCRLCCRELLVQRGSCPLCNNYIVEILDIF